MGRGLRECQVRLVTYFWSSEELGTHGVGEVPLSSVAPPGPQVPPTSGLSLGQDAIGCLGSRSGGCAAAPITAQPRDCGRALEKLLQIPKAGQAGGLRDPVLPGRRFAVSGEGVGCAGAQGTDPDLAHRSGHGVLGAPPDRCLLRCLPGDALGAAAAAHAGICCSGPLEVAEHLCLPGAQFAHGCRGAVRVRALRSSGGTWVRGRDGKLTLEDLEALLKLMLNLESLRLGWVGKRAQQVDGIRVCTKLTVALHLL